MRKSVVALVIAVTTAAGLVALAPGAGAAKKPDPCKVLTTAQIAGAFGGTVSPGVKGLTTAISTQCNYDVSASGTRPAGDLTVTVMLGGAKAAYDGLKNTPPYQTLTEINKAFYSPPPLSVVNVLKGSVLLGVQGGFIDSSKLPLRFVDVKDQLVALAKLGMKKV